MKTAASEQRFMTSDFDSISRKYDIRYHFPETRSAPAKPVLSGHIREHKLASGLHMTLSDVQVISPYESHSTGESPLFICTLLQGQVHFRINNQSFDLEAGMVLGMALNRSTGVQAFHPAGQQLRTLTLAHPTRLARDTLLANTIDALLPGDAPVHWRLPPELHQQLNRINWHQPHSPAEQMIVEGLALQLLGHNAQRPTMSGSSRKISPAEASRLHALHTMILEAPERPYTIKTLAAQAAMSSSRLRIKFRDQFGETLFDFIRRQRLSKAHALLTCGHSIEHTAYLCGYRHTSNFTTAFKRQFSYSPGTLIRNPDSFS